MNQITNKIQIPGKTKTAARILFYVGLFSLLGCSAVLVLLPAPPSPCGQVSLCLYSVSDMLRAICKIMALPGMFILFGGLATIYWRKNGWWLGAVSAFLFEIFSVFTILKVQYSQFVIFFPATLMLIAIALLLIDRKNYFAAIGKA